MTKEETAVALADKVAEYIEATPAATAGDWFNSFRPLVRAYREACGQEYLGPVRPYQEYVEAQNKRHAEYAKEGNILRIKPQEANRGEQ